MRAIRKNRGQALVETAITLPLILLLLMGIIDFGLLFNNYIIISNTAREAARAASLGQTDAVVGTRISSMTTTLDDTRLEVNITPAEASRVHGGEVSVQIIYRHVMLTPFIESMFSGGVPIEATTVMRVE